MESDNSTIFDGGSSDLIYNVTQQSNGTLKSITTELGSVFNENVSEHLREVPVIKDTIKVEMESPRETDQESDYELCADRDVLFSGIKKELQDANSLEKVQNGSPTYTNYTKINVICSEIKVEFPDAIVQVNIKDSSDAQSVPDVRPSNWSSHTSNHNILGQLEEELVVREPIKIEMESPHMESDEEGNDTLCTDVDLAYSDVKKQSNEIVKFDDNNIICEQNREDSRMQQLHKDFSCSMCKESFDVKTALARHMVVHSGEKQFICLICNKSFTRKSSLKEHQLIHSKDKPFSCTICGERFRFKTKLKSHSMDHFGNNPFSCLICSKSFALKSVLSQHKKIHNNKTFSCSVCSKSFLYKSELARHVVSHSGKKSFSCTICSKCFYSKSHLKQHLFIHTGKKPFTCSVCNKSFTLKSSLTNHVLIHSGEKRFACSICGKCFTEKSGMTRHMLVHSGEKRFSCSTCGKCFNLKSNLKKHILVTHSDEKPFSCSLCGMYFTRKDYMIRHIRNHAVNEIK